MMMKTLSWLLAIGAAVALTIIISLANQDLTALNQLLKSGKLAQARVTDRYMNSGKSTTYYLSYEFQASGQPQDYKDEVDSATYYHADGAIEVTYLPENPDILRVGAVDLQRIATKQTTWLGVVLGASSLCAVLGLLLGGMFLGQKKLLSTGECAMATIDSDNIVGSGRDRQRRVGYHFTDSRGEGQARTAVVAPQKCKSLQPGSTAPVFYRYPNPSTGSRLADELSLATVE